MFTLKLEIYNHLDSIMDVFQVIFQDGFLWYTYDMLLQKLRNAKLF